MWDVRKLKIGQVLGELAASELAQKGPYELASRYS